MIDSLSSHEERTTQSLHQLLELHCMSGLNHFKKVLRSYVLFHGIFALLFFLESTFLVVLYCFQEPSSLLAIGIAVLVLTLFSYLILAFYVQAKKPEQAKQLKDWFLSVCKKSLTEDLSPADYHLFLAQAMYTLATFFQPKELPVYLSSFPIPSIQRLIKKCCYLWHWKDFQKMKEVLLLDCIYQHLALLKEEPTSLEVHASLGNSYLTLASVYKSMHREAFLQQAPSSLEGLEGALVKSFKSAITKAMEEYKIIRSSSDHEDPWVLAQLATCYHELEMYDKEIEHFEKILEISDFNHEVMLRLSYLYFQEGRNAQGFKLYKIIKETDTGKAAELFDYYISKAQQEARI